MRLVSPPDLAHYSSYSLFVASVPDKSLRQKLLRNLPLREKHPLTQHMPYNLNQVPNPQDV